MASGYKLLTGKTAVITGCNIGIGKAILEAFAANGADAFACVRKEEQNELLPEQIAYNIRQIYLSLN